MSRHVTADPKHPMSLTAMVFMAASVVIRWSYYGQAELQGFDLWVYGIIPTLAAAWFWAALWIWGKRTLMPTCLSVLGGVFFFIVKAFTFEALWHTVLCCILYLTVLVLYTVTVLGLLPTKKLLYPLFGLPLAFHLFVEDVINYVIPGAPLWDWLPEISVLCIMAALLCLSFAMKKQ